MKEYFPDKNRQKYCPKIMKLSKSAKIGLKYIQPNISKFLPFPTKNDSELLNHNSQFRYSE